MLKKILLGFAALVLLAVAVVGWTVVRPIYQLAREISPSTAPEDYAKQDDSRVQLPTPQRAGAAALRSAEERVLGRTPRAHGREHGRGPLRHDRNGRGCLPLRPGRAAPKPGRGAHAALAAARLRGHHGSRGRLRLGHPLWRARSAPGRAGELLVHADPGASRRRCSCWPPEQNGGRARSNAASRGVSQPPPKPSAAGRRSDLRSRRRRAGNAACAPASSDWARYIELADRHYEPGVFTTFAAYEFSPVLEGAGKHHRNVIFHGEDLPAHAISSQDVGSAIELWRGLEETCTGAATS